MLGAEAAMLDLREQPLQTVIEHKDQLLKILDRVVQLKAPRHAMFFDVWHEQRHTFLLDGVDDILELASVPADKLARRNGEEVLDTLQAEIVKNIQRVLFNAEIGERKLRKHLRRVHNSLFVHRFLSCQQYCRVDRLGDRNTAGDILPLHLFKYFFSHTLRFAHEPFEPAHVEQYAVLEHLCRMCKLIRHSNKRLASGVGDDAGK